MTRLCACGVPVGVTHACLPSTATSVLRRPYEELHAENQRLRDQLQSALTQINAMLERERQIEAALEIAIEHMRERGAP